MVKQGLLGVLPPICRISLLLFLLFFRVAVSGGFFYFTFHLQAWEVVTALPQSILPVRFGSSPHVFL